MVSQISHGASHDRIGRLALSSICGSDGTSCIHDSKELGLAPRTTTAAFKLGSLLDRKRHVMDVPLHLRRGLECNRLSTDDTRDLAADDNLLACNHSCHSAVLTDNNFSRHHVTLDLSVDLKD